MLFYAHALTTVLLIRLLHNYVIKMQNNVYSIFKTKN